MKNLFLYLLGSLVLFSCSQVSSDSQKTITRGEDTLSEVNISLSKMDAVEELSNIQERKELLFKAEGLESGWEAVFYVDKIEVTAPFEKNTITIQRNNTDLDQIPDLKINLSSENDYIFIQKMPCQNASQNMHTRTVKLNYKGKLYAGCGSFLKRRE